MNIIDIYFFFFFFDNGDFQTIIVEFLTDFVVEGG